MTLAVEYRPEGVLLRAVKPFAESRLDQVVGSVGYKGPRKTLAEMETGILREARKQR